MWQRSQTLNLAHRPISSFSRSFASGLESSFRIFNSSAVTVLPALQALLWWAAHAVSWASAAQKTFLSADLYSNETGSISPSDSLLLSVSLPFQDFHFLNYFFLPAREEHHILSSGLSVTHEHAQTHTLLFPVTNWTTKVKQQNRCFLQRETVLLVWQDIHADRWGCFKE